MKQVYISRMAGRPLVRFLAEQGYEINTVTEYGIVNKNTDSLDESLGILHNSNGTCSPTKIFKVDPRISTHPDIYMCQLGLWQDAGIFFGDGDRLDPKYPGDVIYNAVCTKDFVLHRLDSTDPDLMDSIISWRRSLQQNGEVMVLGVRQGYTRCMCLPVDDRSFITSDESIARPLEAQEAHVLRIAPGHVYLPGFEEGFIGGTAGNVYVQGENGKEQRAIVFNGDLSAHPDFERITAFIKSRNILPLWFEDYELTDIGSILAME